MVARGNGPEEESTAKELDQQERVDQGDAKETEDMVE